MTRSNPTRDGRFQKSLHKQIVGGFCNGASLDWLRKVLQCADDSGRTETFTHLKASRVMRMAQTQLALKSGMKTAENAKLLPPRALATSKEDEASRLDSESEEAEQAAKAAVKSWVLANNGTWTESPGGGISAGPHPEASADAIKMFKGKWEQLSQAIANRNAAVKGHNTLVAEANELRKGANALVDTWNKAGDYGTRAMLWDDLVKTLGTDAGKKRRFSGICPVANQPGGTYASFRDFLLSALATPALSPGRGMQIAISLDPGPGHAMALFRESSDTVFLFDPNLGVYKFTETERLVMALVVLVEVGYTGPDEAGKVTKLGTRHGWQVFAKAEKAPPQVKGPGLMSADEIRIACDSANDIIESARVAAEYDLQDKLEQAKKLHQKYATSKSGKDHVDWHNAHNAAVIALKRTRGASLATAQRIYPDLTPQQREWRG